MRKTIYKHEVKFVESGIHNIGMFSFDDIEAGKLYKITLADNVYQGFVLDIDNDRLVLELD